MKAQATNSHKIPQPRRWKPLSQAQENALVLLLQGGSDSEVAADPGVHVERGTVWSWRHEHPLFKAELQQRRANLYGAAFERLRSLVSKAVENVAAKVEAGDYEASIDLLKCIRLYGNGSLNAVHGLDAERNLEELIDQRLKAEAIPDKFDILLDPLKNPAKEQRKAAIEAELMEEFGEPDQ